MSEKKKSFVRGAALLGIVGLVCKVIGAAYRIPMTNLISTNGMAFYQTAYTVYVFLLAVSSAGLPVAISKMVSERVTLGDYKAAHLVFKRALKALIIIGLVTTVLMALLSGVVSNAVARPGAVYSFLALAPSLFFVSVLCAYRGYLQGMNMMAPTALSQLIEQAGKLGIGLLVAGMWLSKGYEYAAAGAMLGVTFSEFLAMLLLLLIYSRKKKQLRGLLRHNVDGGFSEPIGKTLLKLSLPIIIGSCAMPLVQLADTVIVSRSLLSIGYTTMQVDALYGNLTAVVNPLVNMPAVLSIALAMSLVPAISAANKRADVKGLSRNCTFGFKLSMLIGLPCAVGFFVLAGPIISLLYTNLGAEQLAVSVQLLQIMSLGVLFLTILQTLTGVLQGLGRPGIPVRNLFIGVAFKILVSLVLIRIPSINIAGAAIGTAVCYTVAALLDIIASVKHAKMHVKVGDLIVRPLICAVMMGVFTYFLYPVLANMISPRLATLIMVAVAMGFYGLFALAIGAIKQSDADMLPGGSKLNKLMIKLKLWQDNGH